MHWQRIISLMEDHGVAFDAQTWIGDEEYQLPSRRWVEHVFAPKWAELLRRLKLTYKPGTWDCDEFADLCSAYARLLHARTKKARIGTALSFGVFSYVPTNLGHRINVIIVPKTDYIAVPILFEPQPPTRVFDATPEVMRTCRRYRF